MATGVNRRPRYGQLTLPVWSGMAASFGTAPFHLMPTRNGSRDVMSWSTLAASPNVSNSLMVDSDHAAFAIRCLASLK